MVRSGEDSHPIEMWPTPQGQKDLPSLQRRLIVGAVRAAEATGESGELVVRRGPLVGRILFVDGKIAWIHCHGKHGYLADVIVERAGIARKQLDETLAECRASGIPLGEALVAAGLLESAALQEILLTFVQDQVVALLDHADSVALMFLPVRRSYSGDFLFSVDDVLGERASTTGASVLDPSSVVTLLGARAFAVQGAIGGGAVATAEGRAINFATRTVPSASEHEVQAVSAYAQRLANTVALPVDVPEAFSAIETVHVARAHYIYERRLASVTVFLMARANAPIGAFMAAARAATRDLLS
jgi:hypothetical protein